MKHLKTREELLETELRQKGSELYYNKEGQDFWGDKGAGILPMFIYNGKAEFLVGLRGPECNEPGTWGVWGGMIESGEKPAVAAKREFEEESGYTGKIKLVPSYVFKTKGFEYYNFLGIVPKKFEPDLSDALAWETTEARWVTLDEMSKLKLHFGLKSLIENGRKDIEAVIATATSRR